MAPEMPEIAIEQTTTHWRTGDRQPEACHVHKTWRLRIRYAPYQGARKAQQKVAWSTDQGYEQTWATQAAAIAAKADFKAWVNHGRGGKQRTAQLASAAARVKAVELARAEPLLPSRFSGRHKAESELEAPAFATVVLRVGATGAVTLALGVAAPRSDSLLLQWRERSAQVVDRRKRRRDAAEAAAAAIPAGVWADFYERCRKAAKRAESAAASAASTRRTPQRPRGRSRAQQ
eukprot:1168670-Prymnesium_polylepis.1